MSQLRGVKCILMVGGFQKILSTTILRAIIFSISTKLVFCECFDGFHYFSTFTQVKLSNKLLVKSKGVFSVFLVFLFSLKWWNFQIQHHVCYVCLKYTQSKLNQIYQGNHIFRDLSKLQKPSVNLDLRHKSLSDVFV